MSTGWEISPMVVHSASLKAHDPKVRLTSWHLYINFQEDSNWLCLGHMPDLYQALCQGDWDTLTGLPGPHNSVCVMRPE